MYFKSIIFILVIGTFRFDQTQVSRGWKLNEIMKRNLAKTNLIKCTLHYSTYTTGFIGCNK